MSDRELLERAAKAAGFAETGYQDLRGWGEVRYGLSEAIWNGEDYWNPLTNDGDAFMLSVKLRISILFNPDDSLCAACGSGDGEDEKDVTPESARRAIVRAAAALAG